MQEDKNFFASIRLIPTEGLKANLRIDSIVENFFECINRIFILKEKNPMFSFQKSKFKNQI